MIGRRYWIWIWYGILALGLVGLLVSLYWGRHSRWKNLDEVLRAVGTITVSLGMLLLLHQVRGGTTAAYTLFIAALFAFILAFVLGRRPGAGPGPFDDEDDGG